MNQNLNYLFVYCTFVPAEKSLNAQPSPMRGRWAQYRKVHYSAGFDKIHYSGLTIIRRLFFRQTIFAWQFLKALSSDRKNILWIRVRQEFWISRQTKNQHFYFIRQENRFHFSCETNFLTETFSQFEKLFLTQRKMKTIFSPFYFSFWSDNGTVFLVDTNF